MELYGFADVVDNTLSLIGALVWVWLLEKPLVVSKEGDFCIRPYQINVMCHRLFTLSPSQPEKNKNKSSS